MQQRRGLSGGSRWRPRHHTTRPSPQVRAVGHAMYPSVYQALGSS